MRLIALACLLASATACRRHHARPVYEDETVPGVTAAGSPTAGAAPTEPAATPDHVPAATAPAFAPPRMPDGGTINGDPRGPRAAEFNRIVNDAFPKLRACFDDADPPLPAGDVHVVVHYIVEPPGYTGGVSARGDAPRPVLDCCRAVVEALKFPEFHGHKVEQDLPFTWQKREKKTTTEIWDAAPKPE